MVLTVDIGNSNTVLSIFVDDKCVSSLRFVSDRSLTVDRCKDTITRLLSGAGYSAADMEGGIIASVVPSLTAVVRPSVEKLTGKKFMLIGDNVETGLVLDMDSPASVGHDLIVDAVAAMQICDPPMVIFDTGTATTMSVIDKDGHYIGGHIIPGLRISLDALAAKCAQLPPVDIDAPPVFIGKNTVDCMHAGVIYGHAAMIDGLIERTEDVLGCKVKAVATGGLMHLILSHCKKDIIFSEDLLSDGLYYLYKKNSGKKE